MAYHIGLAYCLSPEAGYPARTQTFFTCLLKVHKRLQTLKQCITVFHEHLFDVCEDSSRCEKRMCLAG